MEKKIRIYTDGAAKGNPGPGGFGVIMEFGNARKEFSKGFRLTTNNRMELWAVIFALEQVNTSTYPIHVYSDSKYVIDSIVKSWVFGWEKKGFKGKKNADLWKRYLILHAKFQMTFHWVKGHAGHPQNERCDVLAVAASTSTQLEIDIEYEISKEEGLF